jgi:hypothetical protein
MSKEVVRWDTIKIVTSGNFCKGMGFVEKGQRTPKTC